MLRSLNFLLPILFIVIWAIYFFELGNQVSLLLKKSSLFSTEIEELTAGDDLVAERFFLNRWKADPKTIHVIYAATGSYMQPLLVSMNSLQNHTDAPVCLHILTSEFDEHFNQLVKHYIKLPVEIIIFNGNRLKPILKVWSRKNKDVYSNPFNYARYYLPELFPNYETVIYLDPDTVVMGDISQMQTYFHRFHTETHFLMAVKSKQDPDRFSRYCFLLNCQDPEIASIIIENTPFFNAGVFITNLTRWKEQNITMKLEYWLQRNQQVPLWRWGSQAAFALVFYGHWYPLLPEWNQRDARLFSNKLNTQLPAQIFHFTTDVKPWKSNGRSVWNLWCPFLPEPHNTPFWFCRKGKSFYERVIKYVYPVNPYDFSFLQTVSFVDVFSNLKKRLIDRKIKDPDILQKAKPKLSSKQKKLEKYRKIIRLKRRKEALMQRAVKED